MIERLGFRRKLILAAIGMAAGGGLVAFGLVDAPRVRAQQANDAARLSFEVASIKLNRSPRPLGGRHILGDRFDATASAMGLIAAAYGHNRVPLSQDQVSGGPGWIKSEIFDIDAKVGDSLVEHEWKKISFDQQWGQVMLMLQSLLADRFKLRVNHETKALPVYALVLAKNGPKFAEDESDPDMGGIISNHGSSK